MKLHSRHGAPVYLTTDVRAIELAAAAAPDPPPLMERAGLAAAELARELAGGNGKPVLVIAGPGNNGGDAFVVARYLKEWWFNVTVVFAGDEGKLSNDASQALRTWRAAGGANRPDLPDAGEWGLVVDGIFGIGLERDVGGRYAEWIAAINGTGGPVLALDVPSGLHSDTGRIMGCAVRATHTVTFVALKPGLLTLDGPDHCGELHLRTLGLDSQSVRPASGFLIGLDALKTALKPRRYGTHKGDYGSIGVIGGDHGMVGAALLAARAALRSGAGRVYVGTLARDTLTVDPQQPELMIRSADEVLKLGHLDCLAVGPGLGQAPDAAFYLGIALQSPLPVVLDADALNLIGANPGLASQTTARKAATLMTPHPAEAARLLGITTREVQHDRVSAAIKLAASLNSLIVLKGNGSICAAPDGTWHVNTSGNPGMASAGMGDVLTGIIAALLAQGADAKTALLAGVLLHGAAADALVEAGCGPVGLAAGELIDAARKLLNQSVSRDS
ncbi:MAG: NAD(P)H-hydrate dehydratase [Betaproteobacteria bacterium]|nr:NAD(P)H-hydrate dehydratase [Betaproteobacteria bacterium]MDH3435947.1 NAD(P)H-hydrate dehydratase [Betaproteobacteria bacterium]